MHGQCHQTGHVIGAGVLPIGKDAVDPIPRRYSLIVVPSDPAYPWWRTRGYAHFDRPPFRRFAIEYALNPERVARHAFWPLLRFTKRVQKYQRDRSTGKRYRSEIKTRQICYAAHLDSAIYSKYAHDLSELLERHYGQPFGTGVLAYRRWSPPRSCVHFAIEAFDEILTRGNCDVIALDVSDFFGTLDHRVLKAAWIRLLGVGSALPEDHYAVFRAVTKYSWIDRETVRRLLERDIPRRRTPVDARICTPREFRARLRHGVETNSEGKGIPQGSPISSVLANLYMLDADLRLYEQLHDCGASYRRYSDDILIITRPGDALRVETLVCGELERVMLAVQSTKTIRAGFRSTTEGQRGFRIDEAGILTEKPLAIQYLGLVWNGDAIRLRESTLARYLRRMTHAVRGAEIAARRMGSKDIKRRKLYRQFSHLGRSARVFGPQPVHKRRNRNFIHYALLAARLTESPQLRRQIGRQWLRLEKEITKAELRLRG
jgi:RNA-directed DNA polymerase